MKTLGHHFKDVWPEYHTATQAFFQRMFCHVSKTKRYHLEVQLDISPLHFSQQMRSSSFNNEAKVKTFNYEQIPNMFTLFVGYPGTGKSVSVEQGATSPVLTARGKNDIYLIERATSSVLLKQIAESRKAYVVTSEIYDVLNKLLKSDDDTTSGDIQLLRKLPSLLARLIGKYLLLAFNITCGVSRYPMKTAKVKTAALFSSQNSIPSMYTSSTGCIKTRI